MNARAELAGANELISSIFSTAKSKQVYGVNWQEVGLQQRKDYLKSFLGMEIFIDQEEPLQVLTNPKNKRVTYNASRQRGKSMVLAVSQIVTGVHNTHPALDDITRVIGVANKQSQTQIVANRVRTLLSKNYDRTKYFWDREGSSKFHISFKREAGINSRETGIIDYITANPKAFSEGFTASILYVDEANRIDGKVLSEVLTPFLSSTNGALILTGVSRGMGAFYNACNSTDYIHLHYPWDKGGLPNRGGETYRKAAPADLLFDDGTVFEAGLVPLDLMPVSLKKVIFPTNPMVHILPTKTQEERFIRLWELSKGDTVLEEDFRSQYMLEFLADVMAFLQLVDRQLLFSSSEHLPLEEGKDGEEYWFGLDCAGSRNAYVFHDTNKDRAALSVWTRRGHIKQKVWGGTKDNVLPEELVAWLREMCHPQLGIFKCRGGAVDTTGAVGAFASQHLKGCGIPIIPIFYNKTEEITKKNYKNAIFDHFKLENAAGRCQYPNEKVIDELDDETLRPKYPSLGLGIEEWEMLERKVTASVNSVISAPAGKHDDVPNSDSLCCYAMDFGLQLFQETLSIKKRARQSIVTRGIMSRGGSPFGGRRF